jgi:hypothetical protein
MELIPSFLARKGFDAAIAGPKENYNMTWREEKRRSGFPAMSLSFVRLVESGCPGVTAL